MFAAPSSTTNYFNNIYSSTLCAASAFSLLCGVGMLPPPLYLPSPAQLQGLGLILLKRAADSVVPLKLNICHRLVSQTVHEGRASGGRSYSASLSSRELAGKRSCSYLHESSYVNVSKPHLSSRRKGEEKPCCCWMLHLRTGTHSVEGVPRRVWVLEFRPHSTERSRVSVLMKMMKGSLVICKRDSLPRLLKWISVCMLKGMTHTKPGLGECAEESLFAPDFNFAGRYRNQPKTHCLLLLIHFWGGVLCVGGWGNLHLDGPSLNTTNANS